MPRLWISAAGQWTAVSLDGRAQYSNDHDHGGDRCRDRDADGGDKPAQLTLLRTSGDSAAQDQWVAVSNAGSSLRINGEIIPLGLHVLRDRDAIQSADEADHAGDLGGVSFFSTQSAPIVTPLTGTKALACARCRKKIEPGTPSVRCPTCGAVHHQFQSPAEELFCWTYHTQCARCQRQATALDDRDAWTPQEL